MYSLNIPYSNQNPSFFPLEKSVSMPSVHFGDISSNYNMWRGSHTKVVYFFSCDFDFPVNALVSGFTDEYKAHNLFIVYRPSTKIQLSVQSLLIVQSEL